MCNLHKELYIQVLMNFFSPICKVASILLCLQERWLKCCGFVESVEADSSSSELVEANSSFAESVEADSGLLGLAASSSSGISFSKKWHNLLVVLTFEFFSYGVLVIPSLPPCI